MTYIAEGITYVLCDLHRLADEAFADGTLMEDEDEKKRLMAGLAASRELKRVGVRGSNNGAAVDARATIGDMQDEVCAVPAPRVKLTNTRAQFTGLFERTNMRGFAFFTRGHLNDLVMSTFLVR